MSEFSSLDLGSISVPVLSLLCGLIIFSVGIVSGSDVMARWRANSKGTTSGNGERAGPHVMPTLVGKA